MNERGGFAKFDSDVLDLQARLRDAEKSQEKTAAVSPRRGTGRYSGRVVEAGSPRMQPVSA